MPTQRQPPRTTRPNHAPRGARMLQTRHDLPTETRERLVKLLNARLADTLDLYSQTKHAHWNVKGNDFYQLHLLFDELAETIEKHADTLAERATALGGVAAGTLRAAAAASHVPELGADVSGQRELLDALVERYAGHAERVRHAIDDADEMRDRATADVFTELCRDVDKALYFLESHVQKGS